MESSKFIIRCISNLLIWAQLTNEYADSESFFRIIGVSNLDRLCTNYDIVQLYFLYKHILIFYHL